MNVVLLQATWTPHSRARLKLAEEMLASNGHGLQVITVASAQSDYGWSGGPESEEALFTDLDYWSIGYRRLRGRLLPALKRAAPDVVVLPGWAFRESIVGLGWSIRNSIPRVLVSDSQEVDYTRRGIVELMKGPLVRSFDAALVGGAPHVAYLEGLGFDPTLCFPGCDVVDNAFFARGARPSNDESSILLSCIRLLKKKNVPAILDSLTRNREWTWRIAGDGPERASIEEQVRRLQLGDRVSLLGHIDYAGLPDVYANADVYLQPSLSEPWGLAINEAMAAGLPVLVSDRCGCHEDLVEAGVNGFTFNPADPVDIDRGLRQMLEGRRRWPEMGASSADIVSRWNLDLYATNLTRACNAAIEAARPSKKLWGRLL